MELKSGLFLCRIQQIYTGRRIDCSTFPDVLWTISIGGNLSDH